MTFRTSFMAPKIFLTKALMKVMTTTSLVIIVFFCLLRAVEAGPQWRPGAPIRRRNGGPAAASAGCWTPRGTMDLGQRVYPAGCSRVICKMYAGEPIIEHQFCKALPATIPHNCIISKRTWMRYPDCCPEVYCSPAPPILDKSLDPTLNNNHPSQSSEVRGQTFPSPKHTILRQAEFSKVTTPFPPLFMTTEIIYGSGFSEPYDPTSQANRDEFLHHVSNLDHPYSPDYDSIDNTLDSWYGNDNWNEEDSSEIPYQYRDDIADASNTNTKEVTPYVVTYPTTPDISYQSEEYNSSSPLYHYFNHKEHVQTSPLPFLPKVFENSPTNIQSNANNAPQTSLNPNTAATAQNDETSIYNYSRTSVESITQNPYISPTTYSPSTRFSNRLRPTIPIRRRPTRYPDSRRVTTNSEWATKTSKISFKVSKDPKHPITTTPIFEYTTPIIIDVIETTANTLEHVKTTEIPVERVTKRERISSQVKKVITQRKTTVAPQVLDQVTPSSYEFASPVLDPNNHDLVEFIHSPLDPSALIPGHDTYVKSKSESTMEYLNKNEGDSDQSKKVRRSVSNEQKTVSYDITSDAKDEKDKRRGRPVFYIPWRKDTENNIVTELSTPKEVSFSKSQSLTKLEQKSIIVQTQATTSVPSIDVKNSLANESSELESNVQSQKVETFETSKFSESRNKSIGGMSLEKQEFIHDVLEPDQTQMNDTNSEVTTKSETLQREFDQNYTLDVTDSVLQLNETETTTKLPFITHATVSSTTSFPEQNKNNSNTFSESTETGVLKRNEVLGESAETSVLKKNEVMGTSTVSSVLKIFEVLGTNTETRVPNEHEEFGQDELNITSPESTPSSISLNYTSTRQDRRLSEPQSKSYRRHRGQEPTSTITRSSRPNLQTVKEDALRYDDTQQVEKILTKSIPRHRQRWNHRQNSSTGRTRVYVPALNYERMNESNNADSSPNKPKINSVELRKPVSSEQVTTQIFDTVKSNDEVALGRESSQGKQKSPLVLESTNEQIRKQLSAQFIKQETRNEFRPHEHIITHSSKPNSFDRSRFSSTLNSSLPIEHIKDSFRELEVYSSHYGDPHTEPSRPLQTRVPVRTKSPQHIHRGSISASSLASTRIEDSLPYFHDYQIHDKDSFPESTSPSSISATDFKPQYNNWFTDVFGESRTPNLSLPLHEDDGVHSVAIQSRFPLSRNKHRYNDNRNLSRVTTSSRNFTANKMKGQNPLIAPYESNTNIHINSKSTFVPKLTDDLLSPYVKKSDPDNITHPGIPRLLSNPYKKISLGIPNVHPPTPSSRLHSVISPNGNARFATLCRTPKLRPISRNKQMATSTNSSQAEATIQSPVSELGYSGAFEASIVSDNQNKTNSRPATVKLVSITLMNSTAENSHPKESDDKISSPVVIQVSPRLNLRGRNSRRKNSVQDTNKTSMADSTSIPKAVSLGNLRPSPPPINAELQAQSSLVNTPKRNQKAGRFIPSFISPTQAFSINARNSNTNMQLHSGMSQPVRSRQHDGFRTVSFSDDLQVHESNLHPASYASTSESSIRLTENSTPREAKARTYTQPLKPISTMPAEIPSWQTKTTVNSRQRALKSVQNRPLALNAPTPSSSKSSSFPSRGSTSDKPMFMYESYGSIAPSWNGSPVSGVSSSLESSSTDSSLLFPDVWEPQRKSS